jgi:hypothetical protein
MSTILTRLRLCWRILRGDADSMVLVPGFAYDELTARVARYERRALAQRKSRALKTELHIASPHEAGLIGPQP